MTTLSSIPQPPNLILGQGPLGFAFKKASAQWDYPTLTWSSSGRHQSDFQGDIATYPLNTLPLFSTIVIAISAPERTPQAYAQLYQKSLYRFLSQVSFKRILFCSSTVVYASSEERWCDEETLEYNQNFRAYSLLCAERFIKHYAANRYVILRIGGLESSPCAHVKKQVAGPSPWRNLVWRGDVCKIIEKIVFQHPDLCGTFNICSDSHPYRHTEPDYGKKISNLKIKAAIGYQFQGTYL